MHFLNENIWITNEISLKFVPMGPINNIPAWVQIMGWRRPGDKPLSEPMLVSLLTHICATRPQWVKGRRTSTARGFQRKRILALYAHYCTDCGRHYMNSSKMYDRILRNFATFSVLLEIIMYGVIRPQRGYIDLLLGIDLSFNCCLTVLTEITRTILTQCGLVTSYHTMDLDQHWLR